MMGNSFSGLEEVKMVVNSFLSLADLNRKIPMIKDTTTGEEFTILPFNYSWNDNKLIDKYGREIVINEVTEVDDYTLDIDLGSYTISVVK